MEVRANSFEVYDDIRVATDLQIRPGTETSKSSASNRNKEGKVRWEACRNFYIEVVGPPRPVRTVICVETVSSLELFVDRLGLNCGRGVPVRAAGLDV